MTQTVDKLMTEVPETLRAAVEQDARQRDLSVNAVVVAILADAYGVQYDAPRYPYTTTTSGGEDWYLRLPQPLYESVRNHSRRLIDSSMRGVILMAVANHYGLPSPSPRRRRDPAIPAEVVAEARARYAEGVSIRELARDYGVHRMTLTKAVRAA